MRTQEKIKILKKLRNITLIAIFVYLALWVTIGFVTDDILLWLIAFFHFTYFTWATDRLDKQIRHLEIVG